MIGADLELKTEVIDAYGLPVRCVGGSLGEVRVTVPWRELLGGGAMKIEIDQVLVLLAPRSANEAEALEVELEAKRALADAAEGVEDQQEAQEEMLAVTHWQHACTSGRRCEMQKDWLHFLQCWMKAPALFCIASSRT